MIINANLNKLKIDIEDRINWTYNSRKNDRKKATNVRIFKGVVSAIITLFIALDTFYFYAIDIFEIIPLIGSFFLTIVLAWDEIFNHKKLWLNAAMTLNELYELETDICHFEATNQEIKQDEINEFYIRYKNIMKNSNERWYKIRE